MSKAEAFFLFFLYFIKTKSQNFILKIENIHTLDYLPSHNQLFHMIWGPRYMLDIGHLY